MFDIPETLAIREVVEALKSERHRRICTMIMEGYKRWEIRDALHLSRFKLYRELRAIRERFIKAGFEPLHTRRRRRPARSECA